MADSSFSVLGRLRQLVRESEWLAWADNLVTTASRLVGRALGRGAPPGPRLSTAPHSIALYQRILSENLEAGVSFVTLREVLAGAGAVNGVRAVLRHDIDLDPRTLRPLAAVEEGLGIGAAVFVRADGITYRLADHLDCFAPHADSGGELGLHSTAYYHRDWRGALESELRTFRACFGSWPTLVNTHGDHPKTAPRVARRTALLAQLARGIPGVSGYVGCDQLYSYRYVAEDCHFDADRTTAYVCEDMLQLAKRCGPGRTGLLLIHPEYWASVAYVPYLAAGDVPAGLRDT